MRPQIIIAFLLLTVNLFGQQSKKTIQFKMTDYPSSKFITKSDTSLLGEVQIIITNTHPKNSSFAKFLCRSWLTIKRGDKVLSQKHYDIEPVGSCSGLYKPTKQPCKDYFILSKFGDYEGETLLVDSLGKLTVLTGGSFSLSEDKNLLFTTHYSDISGITIYNLKSKQKVLQIESEEDKEFYEFYYKDNNYYVSYYSDEVSTSIKLERIDIKTKKLVSIVKPKLFFNSSNKLVVYNDTKKLGDCNCGK
jgi:hypothetical protein